jgi:hypothetical protein
VLDDFIRREEFDDDGFLPSSPKKSTLGLRENSFWFDFMFFEPI